MKYCLPLFNDHMKYFDQQDELIIRERAEEVLSSKGLLTELAARPHTIFILTIDNDLPQELKDILFAIVQEHKNLKVRLPYINEDIVKEFQEHQVPFYFANPVCSWDVLNNILWYKPTDVLVCGEIAFDIKTTADKIHAAGAQVRVIPNMAIGFNNHTNALNWFFVRPEATPLYEPWVDIYEIVGDERTATTTYKVYAIDKKWSGNLKDLIIGLPQDIDNRAVFKAFDEFRISCELKCEKNERLCCYCKECLKVAAKIAEFKKKN